jgi:hypothetical protein
VATMLEKLKFRQLVEETLTVTRVTRAMPWYQFILSMVLALYVGFSRLHHLRVTARHSSSCQQVAALNSFAVGWIVG